VKVEERNNEGLRAKVGGYKSYFLDSKENRKPLPEAIIRALLPTEKEAPKVAPKKEAPKAEKAPAAEATSEKETKAVPKEEGGAPAAAPKSSAAPAAVAAPAPAAVLKTDEK
jgi:hypothetical protein